MGIKEDALKWLEKNDNFFEENSNSNAYIISDDGKISCSYSIDICEKNLKELPFKFGTINGDFICDTNKLKNFNNFPDKITGGLDAYDNRYENYDNFPPIIEKHCNIMGKRAKKLVDLSFLEDSIVGEFFIQDGENDKNIFENGIPEDYKPYVTRDNDDDFIISKNNFKRMIDDGIIVNEHKFTNYLDSYDLNDINHNDITPNKIIMTEIIQKETDVEDVVDIDM